MIEQEEEDKFVICTINCPYLHDVKVLRRWVYNAKVTSVFDGCNMNRCNIEEYITNRSVSHSVGVMKNDLLY